MPLFCVSIKKNVRNYAIDYIRYSNFRGVKTLKNVCHRIDEIWYIELRVTLKKSILIVLSNEKLLIWGIGTPTCLSKKRTSKSSINSDDIPKEELRL